MSAKLYDVMTDTFITDRDAIIDELVQSAGQALTFSERVQSGNPERWARVSTPAKRVIRDAAKPGSGEMSAVAMMVRLQWRGLVTHEVAA